MGRQASIYGRYSEEAESLGDRVGDPEAANLLWAAAGRLRDLARERTQPGLPRDGRREL